MIMLEPTSRKRAEKKKTEYQEKPVGFHVEETVRNNLEPR
jgi:hypothetical protein